MTNIILYKILRASLILGLCGLLVPVTFAQKTLHYGTETKVKLHMMGRIGNMLGNKPTKSEIYVNEQNMRSNDGDRSFSIFSIPKGTIASADAKKKTYYEMGFDEMTSMFASMQKDTRQQAQDAGYDPEDFEFDVSVTDLNESEEIAGYTANKKLFRLEMRYTTEAVDDEGNPVTTAGKFYAVSIVSLAQGVPGFEIIETFGKNYATKMGNSFARNNAGFASMQQAFMSDSRMKPAMEKLAEETKQLEGAPLRTITYLILGPEGEELNLDFILKKEEPAPKKKKGGLGRFAKKALKGRGISIGDEEDPSEQSGEIKEQTILTETETLYTFFEIVSDDAGMYEMPGNFKRVDPPYTYTPTGEN